jgi:hypothetical protein
VLENPDFSSFRQERLGPGWVGGGVENDLLDHEPTPPSVQSDEPVSIPTSPEVAEYMARQQQPQRTLVPQVDDVDASSVMVKNGASVVQTDGIITDNNDDYDDYDDDGDYTISMTTRANDGVEDFRPPSPRGTRFWTEQQDAWDESVRNAESKAQSAKEWMAAKFETVREKLPTPPTKQHVQQANDTDTTSTNLSYLQRIQLWNQAKEADEDVNGPDDQQQSEPQAEAPAVETDATSHQHKIPETLTALESLTKALRTSSPTISDASIPDPSDVPDDIDEETRQKYEDWKRSRVQQSMQTNVIQDVPPRRTTTPTAASSTKTPSSTSNPTRRVDPAQFKKADQTIIVQAVRNDGKTNTSSNSADFVSGRAMNPPPPPSQPPFVSRPFFIESPEDLFFVDIGEAAMIKLAIEAQQSQYYREDRGGAQVSTVDGSGNWESGPYEYQVTTPEVDHPESWLGNLLSKFRVYRGNRPSDRIIPKNPKDEYTEFAVRRMPSGTSSSRRRYERSLQRSTYRSPYGYDNPRTRRRRVVYTQEGADMFPSAFEYSRGMELPQPLPPYFYDYEITRPQGRMKPRRQRRRRPPSPPPPFFPSRRF